MDTIVRDRLLLSIADHSLVMLCGAGLSMAAPSKVPSARAICRSCFDNYSAISGIPLANGMKEDLEALSSHFHANNLFYHSFLKTIVPWRVFFCEPNLGHHAIADFLAINAFQFVVSTNYDDLIESAMHKLGNCDFDGSIVPTEIFGGPIPFSPLQKIHGCVHKREYTVWCKDQLLKDVHIQKQISAYSAWLKVHLSDKDILIAGFWSDWEYLNEVLFNPLIHAHPRSVTLVDPLSAIDLQGKAPDLWRWANGSGIFFHHARQSAAEFLDELRAIQSRTILSRPLVDSQNDYTAKYGSVFSGENRFDDVTSTVDLYALRRNLDGLPSTELVRNRHARPEQRSYALALMRMLEIGGTITSDRITFRSKTIRLIHGAGQPMSSIKSRFIDEPPVYPEADYTVCAGASDDVTPAHIVRTPTMTTVVRPAVTGRWLNDDQFLNHELGAI